MELKWLEDVLSLSTTLSFSRAARERNVTQSALSRRVKQLEDWLGSPLFDRSSYPIRLTEAGKTWLDENRAAVDGVMQRMALAAKLVSGEQTPEVVREAFHTLRHAVQMKPGGWSDAETAKVVEALMKAVRDISGE